MNYPKHTPLAVAALATVAAGYGALKPQPAPLAPPHMAVVHASEHLERQESRVDCEKACARLRVVKCSLGSSLYCEPTLQDGTTPLSPHVEASCTAIAAAIDLDDARRMGVRCE